MKFEQQLTSADQQLVDKKLRDFVPLQVFDIHAHPVNGDHFGTNPNPFVPPGKVLGLDEYRAALGRWLPAQNVDGLFFGFPRPGNDRRAINQWLAAELKSSGLQNSRALALVSAQDDPAEIGEQISRLGLVGIKPYHVYASRPDTMNAALEEFAPEWMWELCHGIQGVLMLHIVRERAIADEGNQTTLRRLCRKYPDCRVVLAHVARSFNYRHAYEGLSTMRDLDNVCIDTSAVTEMPAFRKAIEVLGPRRVLFGTDYPISELRGKCTSVGDSFCWVYSDTLAPGSIPVGQATLVGIESLLCLREACEDSGLSQGDIQDIFYNNALRLLAPHLPTAKPVL
jgi:glutamate-1-semialdehyde 2,1-aminomutase